MKQLHIDINCDLGEGIGNDARLMPLISSCNIACGGHTGDEQSMMETILMANKHHVKIGAHPSFPDRKNFGRKEMSINLIELSESIQKQLFNFECILEKTNTTLHHVKPHGALYNVLAKDRKIALLFLDSIRTYVAESYLYAPYGSVIHTLAVEQGFRVKTEAFMDRNYTTDLALVSRNHAFATIQDPEKVYQHVLRIIKYEKVMTWDGAEVPIKANTFCVHGDNPKAVEILKYLHQRLPEKSITIA